MFSLGQTEEIPEEEYPFVGFGISWMMDYTLNYHSRLNLAKPSIAYLEETPSMAGADGDLIYWWHKQYINYPELENRARCRMIHNSLKLSKFKTDLLREHVDFIEDRQTQTPDRAWIFRVSRIGIDIQSRQAIGHFYVDPASCYLNLGANLIMGWDEGNTIYLIKDHLTIGPGK
jgi:hypothetical protein